MGCLFSGLAMAEPLSSVQSSEPSFQMYNQPLPLREVTTSLAPESAQNRTHSSTHTGETIEPSFVTLNLENGVTQELEIIQWPDGVISLPVKTLASLFNIQAQPLDDGQTLLFVDSMNGKKVEIDSRQKSIVINDVRAPVGGHPPAQRRGLLIQNDIYVDKNVLADLWGATFQYDADTTTLFLKTNRQLVLPARTSQAAPDTESRNFAVIRNPERDRSLLHKVSVQSTGSYVHQASLQPGSYSDRLLSESFATLMNTPSIGVSGAILGKPYYIRPTFVLYNGRISLQDLEWSMQHEMKNAIVSLGSTQAGLSALTSPSMKIWGLKFASLNALTPTITPDNSREFSGAATNGNKITVRINNRMVQTVTAKNNSYEFDPVYLEPQAINHIQIVESDAQNHEKLLLDQKVSNYNTMLTKGKSAYSTFLGRTPLQFFPLQADEQTPLLMPQSEKWLTGGRYFYGLNNRLTAGVSVAADRNFGQPKTYFTSLNPLTVNMTGLNSYLRDPNFFSGQNVAATMRYQATDCWLLSADAAISQMTLKPGSQLDLASSNFGRAGQLHLERQGQTMTWFANAFYYDPYYYTPEVTLYGNSLYDKRGLELGVNGSFKYFSRLSYNIRSSRYQTNLAELVPGGIINANHWSVLLNNQINNENSVSLNANWSQGENRTQEFIQRSLDLSFRTSSLPWKMEGEIKASHYHTNTLFYLDKTLTASVMTAEYTNNSLDTLLNIPLSKHGENRIRIGHRFSTFVNYGYAQGTFKFGSYFVEPLIQLSYGDKPQIQNRFGCRLGYQLRSGARVSLSYYKNLSTFAPENLFGRMLSTRVNSDQFYMDFTEVLGLLGSQLKALGPKAEYGGMITGTVFVDYRANGKYEKQHEPGVKQVQLLVDKQYRISTDEKGRYLLSALSAGNHTVEVMPDSLPLSVGAENPVYKIRVEDGKFYKVNIPLASQGGTISGQIALSNIKGEAVPVKGMVLVLLDSDNKLLSYTAVDSQGFYKFNNIAAGRYKVDLESKNKLSGYYKVLKAPGFTEVNVPQHYEQNIEVKNQNFKILAL